MKRVEIVLRWLTPALIITAAICWAVHCEGIADLRTRAMRAMHPEQALQVPLEVIVEGRSVFLGLRSDIQHFRDDDGMQRVYIRRRDYHGVNEEAWEMFESRDIEIRTRN